MYHSPPPAPPTAGARSLPLGWLGQALLAALPSALAALVWLFGYGAMPYRIRVAVEATMLVGMAVSAMYWLALRRGRFRWHSGILALGAAWSAGYGAIMLIYEIFHATPTVLRIRRNDTSGYMIDWSIIVGAAVIGIILAGARAYLLRGSRSGGRAALLLTAIGHTVAWVGLFPLMFGGYIA